MPTRNLSVLHDVAMPLYEVKVAIRAERSWCLEHEKRVREGLMAAACGATR